MSELLDVMQAVTNKALSQMYTTIPAKVEKIYKKGKSTVVDVLPLIDIVSASGVTQDNILQEVPIVWPSGGGCYITFPLAVGDNVLLHFSMKAISGWKNSDGKDSVTPLNKRRFNKNDAFAVPSIYPFSEGLEVDSKAISINSGGVEIRITKEGSIELGKGATEKLLKGDAFKAYLDPIMTALKTHTHPVSGTTAAASPALATVAVVPATALSEVSKTL